MFNRPTDDLGQRLLDRSGQHRYADTDKGKVLSIDLICRSGRLLLLCTIATEQAQTRSGEARFKHAIINISTDHFQRDRGPAWHPTVEGVLASYRKVLADFGF
jgi:hypothetical protein